MGEAGSLSFATTLSQVTGHEKNLAIDYLKSKTSYSLQRNHSLHCILYRNTKAFPH